MTRFVLGLTTLQFNCDPIRPSGERPKLFQQTGRTSNGDLYIYSKSSLQRTAHRLRFPRVDDATRTSLLGFIRTDAQGTKNSFTWVDHAEVSRTVKFTVSKVRIEPVGPSHFAIEIILQEDQ